MTGRAARAAAQVATQAADAAALLRDTAQPNR